MTPLTPELQKQPRLRFDSFDLHCADLVLWNLRYGINRIDGQRIAQSLSKVEGHEYQSGTGPLGHPGVRLYDAAPPRYTHTVAILDSEPRRIDRVDLDALFRNQRIKPTDAPGHGAGVIVLEDAPGCQHHRIFVVGQLGGWLVLNGLEFPQAASELSDVQNRRAGMVRRRAGPLKPTLLKPLKTDATVARRHLSDLVHNIGGTIIIPALRAQPLRNPGDDLPVGSRLTGRVHDLAHALDAPLGIAERPILLRERRRRKHDIRHMPGLIQENILHD